MLLIIFLSFGPSINAQEFTSSLSIIASDTVYHLSESDIKKGERLFYGLMRDQEGQQSCISCHNVLPTDTFNWNPSALEIAISYESKSLEEFKQVLWNPPGIKMAEVHKDYIQLDEPELAMMKGFLIHFSETGGERERPVINNWLYVIGLLFALFWAVLEMIWFRRIRYRFVPATVMLAALLFLTKFTVNQSIALGRSENYKPDQPIKFSHLVHAGVNEIDCQYCHYGTEDTKSAGIMGISNCLNCHMIVREGSRSGTFEIDKIFIAMDTLQESVEWVRIHNLPDYVYFNHAQHIGAGKLECEECHGQVDEMNAVYQDADLSMGWCLDCHRTRSVQFLENDYYASTYAVFHEQISEGLMDSVLVEDIGGANCMMCHY